MSDFVLVCDSDIRYPMTASEKQRYQQKRSTTGRQYPFFIFDNGNEIFMNKVIGIEVDNYVAPKIEVVVNSPVIQIEDIPKMDEAPTEKQIAAKEKEEKDKKLLEEMYAKSNCKHENVSLFFQDTKKGKRYFPVCDFCGHRGRYIKTDNVTVEEKDAAQIWVER